MDSYFESDAFASSLSPLTVLFDNYNVDSKEIIGYVVGISLKYYMLFNGMNKFDIKRLNMFVGRVVSFIVENNITKFQSSELNRNINHLLINELCSILNINENNITPVIRKELGNVVALSLERYDYKFHGFNSYFLNSIRENGLNPYVKDEQNEIEMINKIYAKYGLDMGLGWSMYDRGKVSYSKTPMVSYDYAIRSPEWFSQFTGDNNYFKKKSFAFVNNDYNEAKDNILNLMEKYNFTSIDRQIVIDFFDKNWRKYANQKPMIAIVEDRVSKELLDAIINTHKECGYIDNLDELLPIAFYDNSIDCKTDDVINMKQAKFIELPRPSELLNRIYLYSGYSKSK